jgi:hypothetical protein
MDPKQDRQMRSRGAALSGNLVIAAVKVTSGVSENAVSLSVAMMRGELPKPPAPVPALPPSGAA